MNISILLPLHILQILINFVAKTVFIRTLGQDYLGINVLFGDITTLLSLTELGLNSAIMFSLYRPLNHKDHEKISAIINYSRSIFNKIALIITLAGLAIIPFLKFVVHSELEMPMIIWYYILYLITVSVTYLATYKATLISADEKNYIVKIYYTVTNGLRAIVQIALLYLTKNFTLYLIAGIVFNLILNFAISMKVNKDYPYLNSKAKLSAGERKEMFNNTKAVFKNKIAGLVLNNTDNIIISSFLSTLIVGQYSGYTTLYTTLMGLMGNFYSGIVSTIGKLNTSESSGEKHHTFNNIHTVIFILAAVVSVCFFLLADDFINLWIGPEYIMSTGVLAAIVTNFYIAVIFYPVEIYKHTTKLFVKIQNIVIITAITNIILSIIFVQFFGLPGILFATGISKLVTIFWAEPFILFKSYFNSDNNDFILYLVKLMMEAAFVILVIVLLQYPISLIPAATWGQLILKGFICCGVVTVIIMAGLSVSSTYREIMRALFRTIKNKIKK
jgi:O-antigen/teichoic acid export membrane protein